MTLQRSVLALSLLAFGCDTEGPQPQEAADAPDTSEVDEDIEEMDSEGDWVDSEGEEPVDGDIDEFGAPVDPQAVGFPTGSCRSGFNSPNSRICATPLRYNTQYYSAQASCRASRARVCSREDYFYIYTGPNAGSYNANGKWLGNSVGDDQALCGNRDVTSYWDSDKWNFDGTCNVNDVKEYRCCHDRE